MSEVQWGACIACNDRPGNNATHDGPLCDACAVSKGYELPGAQWPSKLPPGAPHPMVKENEKLRELGRVTVEALRVRKVPEQWPAFNALIARWERILGEP